MPDTSPPSIDAPSGPQPLTAVSQSFRALRNVDASALLQRAGGVVGPVVFAIVQQPTRGTVMLDADTGRIMYTSTGPSIGLDQLKFTVTQDGVTSNVATVDITVDSATTNTLALEVTPTTPVRAGNCAQVKITRTGRYEQMNVASQLSVTTTPGIALYADGYCGTFMGTSLPAASLEETIFFSVRGGVPLGAHDVVVADQANVFASATKSITYIQGFASTLRLSGPMEVVRGSCAGPYVLEAKDSYGHITTEYAAFNTWMRTGYRNNVDSLAIVPYFDAQCTQKLQWDGVALENAYNAYGPYGFESNKIMGTMPLYYRITSSYSTAIEYSVAGAQNGSLSASVSVKTLPFTQ